MDISFWTLWMTLQCVLQLFPIIFLLNQAFPWWFHFYWLLHVDNKNFKQGGVKWYRQKLRNLNHKGKHNIGWYCKSLLIFTDYQVQRWWTMVKIPVKDKPYDRNVRENPLKRSWHTHLEHPNP